ncbi:multidrug resistance protein homolog 65-like [Episyrphus balteatus]|uniref:multidrug resistance protein homolog 65-like n=1 Tax=Episyrphus balteatus TaxID=286459 RepID=UPI002485235F|nr:multidrug resistance protein homolog 65-like [Episyrphus balteatus]
MTVFKALALPAIIIVYSEFIAMLVDRKFAIRTSSKTYVLPLLGGGKILTNATREENNNELYNDSIACGLGFAIMAGTVLISGTSAIDIFNSIGLKQVTRIRMKLFRAIIRKDISWHDTTTQQNFAQYMTNDIEKIRDGISEKIVQFLDLVIGFIATVIISFGYGWKLTMLVVIYIPIVLAMHYYVTKHQTRLTILEQNSYSRAGNLVEEVLSSIRTIVAFSGENKESARYDNYLVPVRKAGSKKGAFSGLSDGVLKGLVFISCAAAFWYGVNLVLADRDKENKDYTPAILMIAFFGILVGGHNIARLPPFLESFATAKGSAAKIFRIIDSKSDIDPMSAGGKVLNNGLRGEIEFQDVFFRYPSRDDISVLRGLNFKVKQGQTVAIVGSSGCGKSTCIQLLQRFYDPAFGQVLLDELDAKKYNINWLRSNIACVGQEPILFQGTVGENIKHGKSSASQKEIEAAAKLAGVHDFIINLPESYQTVIGEKGAQLSGGQKQRIAIARALIQNPKILLLDEATSALDYQSERLVQEALDLASKGRTTIVVSHRVSAIKSADRIFFLDQGKVVEEGSHNDLMKMKGMYYRMVHAGDLQTVDANDQDVEEKNKPLGIYEKSFELNANNLDKNQKDVANFETPVFIDPKNDEDEKEDKTQFVKIFIRIFKMSRPEYSYLIFGVIAATLYGFTFPAFAIAFGEFYAALSQNDENEARSRTAVLSICCLIIGIITGISCFFQTYLFNLAGAWLTIRIRSLSFKSIMKQEIGWFDEEKNSVGALSARLAGDAANIQGAIGFPLSGLIQAFSNYICSGFIAFYYSWKLTLMCLSTCPFIFGSVIYEASFMSSSMLREKQILEEASRIATEAIVNIRTIAGLRRESELINKFNEEMRKGEMEIRKKLRYRGIINSLVQAFLFLAYAFTLSYGGILVAQGSIPFQDIIKVSETLLYGSLMLAQSLVFAPAFTTSLVSAHRLFQVIDRKPKIQSLTNKCNNISKVNHNMDGVHYRDIEFRYPTRSDAQILNGINLEVLKGKTVALVGNSGCGKSTCIQLLQRFYDTDNGNINIDQNDIKTDLSLETLRSKLGLVSQEPSLFERTIAENIAYGDNSRNVSIAEIIEAAKYANAHSFIISLPMGYDTRLGSRGTQLSGGQKQRIAIARALVRNPKILLLDEATSALDLQSEKVVQQALDMACSGRTCIVIAHRLSTIQNADVICVLQNGQVAEQGNHRQLIARDGLYARLHKTQPSFE